MKNIKSSKERTIEDSKKLSKDVENIIERVRLDGDKVLKELNEKFDNCHREKLQLSQNEINQAYNEVSPEEIEDIKKAAKNIEAFAIKQRETINELKGFSPSEGMELGHKIIPIEACLCYIPGGNYPLYSSALMLGIPAKVAGVKRIVACSPVMKGTNKIHPKTVVAMDIAGIEEIYAIGGAQAIAGFTYGTETINPVKIIVGPGNSYVTEAKRQCYGKVGIDFLAGPSEVLVITDESGDPEIIAADLLAQAEHDLVAKSIVITLDESLGYEIIKAVEKQLKPLTTKEIASKSWEDYGEILLANSIDEAIEYSNKYAPEHLEVMVKSEIEEITINKLTNFGSLFIGQNTAEVFGDYASGTNHTLPTLGAAAYTGGVFVGTFLKTCTYQKFTKKAMNGLAPLVANLAHGEGLEGHAKAAEIRMKK